MQATTDRVQLSPERIQELVGGIAVKWAALEFALDCIVAITFHEVDKGAIRTRIPLQNMQEKVKYLRDCFGELPSIARFRTQAERLLGGVDDFKMVRRDVIHGYVTSFSIENDTITFIRLSLDDPRTLHVQNRTIMTAVELESEADSMLELAHELADLAAAMLRVLLPESPVLEAVDQIATGSGAGGGCPSPSAT